MLRPDEFHVGNLAGENGDSLTLLLPRSQYEQAALIGQLFDQRYGIVLNGDLPGQAYLVGDDGWQGILVRNVAIEMDPTSAFDPAGGLAAGALIREGSYLSVAAVAGPHPRVGRPVKIVLVKDLPPCEEREAVGFGKWRIVIGEAENKRELLSLDVESITHTRAATLTAGRS